MSETDIQNPLFRRLYSHVNSAVAILQQYGGGIPFAHYIKSYFAQYKKFGSKDRRQITNLCYCYFRLGQSYPGLTIEQKVVKSYQLSKGDWEVEWLSFFEGFNLPDTPPDNIFAFSDHLSSGIESAAFTQSHLIQPDLFLRIRPGCKDAVIDKLQLADIPFSVMDHTLRMNNSVKIEDILLLNRDVVVQDQSSQAVGELLQLYQSLATNKINPLAVWDCCAASGGKAILAKDILGKMELTVSDIRPSILFNLKKRFQQARIKDYDNFVADATTANPGKKFDLIIADVPCSGSGTWARTPEQLQYFQPARIEVFAKLQTAIITNAVQYLQPGGYLLYITCSAFAEENEQQLNLIQQSGLQQVAYRFLRGYEQRADTMFAALLKK